MTGALAVAAVAAAYFAVFVGYGVNLEDEGTILFQIARAFRGELPYVDFHTGYTPGVFWLNAGLFAAFGESVLPIRWVLVGVNAAATGLLYALARPFAGRALAAAAALGWAAFLPAFVGEFASFNVPYPAWYAGLAWLATQWAMDRHLVHGGRGALLAAGLAAGLAFDFKPNAGALAVLACGLVLALIAAGQADRDRGGARLLLVLGAGALVVIFAHALVTLVALEELNVDFPLIAGVPLGLIAARLVRARAPAAHPVALWPSIGLVAAGALVPTLPWVVYFLARLGPADFLREVLLIGSGAEAIYATPYPLPLGFPGGWALLAALGLVAVGGLGLAAERGRVHVRRALAWIAFGAAAGAVLLWRLAHLPEGLARSVFWQVQQIGFFAVPPLTFAVAVVVLRRLSGAGRFGAADRRLLGALVFALCMYVQLYPRIDSMHLVVALPSALVLAAGAAARLARAWGAVLRVPPAWLRAGLVGGAAVLALIAAVPRFEGPSAAAKTALDTPAAPVAVESARADDVLALNLVFRRLRSLLRPDETFFGFPALALAPYALQRRGFGPHDYFFPGRPDHGAEAEAVRALAAAPPRYVLTMNRRLGFFLEAPAYYFILREWVGRHYVLAERVGRYDILRRRDVPGPAFVARPEPVPAPDGGDAWRAALAEYDRDRRRTAIAAFLAAAGDAAGVAPLADRWAPDPATRLLVIRALGEFGDARGLPFLMDAYDAGTLRISSEAQAALTLFAVRTRAAQYHLAPEPPPDLAAVGLDRARLRDWFAAPAQRRKVGVFAAHALAELRDAEAIPVFEQALESEQRISLRLAAAEALVRLGRPRYMSELAGFLGVQRHEVQDRVPSFLIAAAAEYPDEVAAALAHMLAEGNTLAREVSAWTAGAARVPAAPALRRALDDAARPVRIAATWALGVLGDRDARPALARLAADDDPTVRAFAREALARIATGDHVARRAPGAAGSGAGGAP